MSENPNITVTDDDPIRVWDEVVCIQKKMNQSLGKQVLDSILTLKDTQYIFDQNYLELTTHLKRFQDKKFVKELQYDKSEMPRTVIHRDTSKYLFNYLSAARALFYHTFSFMKKYEGTPFDTQCTNEVKQRIPRGINEFIRILRNLLVHQTIPRNSLQFTLGNVSTKKITWNTTLVLDITDSKRTSDIWNEESWEYIQTHYSSSDIDIKKFCDDYHQIITEYYSWFFSALKEYHANDLKEYEELKNEYELKASEYNRRQNQYHHQKK